ncbi:Vacuolar protein sorting-associated protein 53 [Thecaphora frezii]
MAAASSAQPAELPHQLALQIHRALDDATSSAATPPPATPLPSGSSAAVTASAPPAWLQPPRIETQVDALLAQHQPLSLHAVGVVHARLRQEIQTCQATIDRLTAQLEHETDAARMLRVQQAIAALLQQLDLIREKARESETVVKEITRDIRSLDVAKRNVVASMTALKRLQMLVNGVDQLERLAETKRYREAASALQAVKSLLDFFQSYRGVERIAIAWKQVNELQTQLRTSVMQDYERFFLHDAGRSVRPASLAEAALVLDAIGLEARNALIEWYCALQLKEYRRIFRATDEAGQLDNVSRRFAWFRRVLKVHEEEHAAAFVRTWHVDRWLVRRFSEITREDLQSVLIREQARLNCPTLLEALNATLEFEVAMGRTFGLPFDEVVAAPTTAAAPGQPGPSAAAAALPTSVAATARAKGQSLSSVFDPHLIIFVEAQDRALAEMFQNYRRQGASLASDNGAGVDGRSGAEGPGGGGGFGANGLYGSSGSGAESGAAAGSGAVLPSSTEMFFFYRQTLEQCARLSNREAFKELSNVYRKWLRIYADDILRAALIRNEPTRKSIDVRPNMADLQKWCLVLNTADYCASTSSQLEDKLRDKIHPDFRNGVNLEEEREIFTTIISYAVQTVARELELCSEPVWSAMLRPQPPSTPWNQLRQVAGPSAYVGDLASLLEQIGVVVRQETENKRFVRSWCDKVVAVVVGRFTNTLVKLRPISRIVAEQLLTDLGQIRKRLEELPRYPSDDGWGAPPSSATSTAAASYVRYVNKLTGRVETLLRVVMAPISAPAPTAASNLDNQGQARDWQADEAAAGDLISVYRRQVGDRSFSNFQKILDLKGVRKVEANELLDRFLQDDGSQGGASLDTEADDGTASADAGAAATVTAALGGDGWLSKLDMDPPTAPLLPSPFDGTATPPGRSSLHLFTGGARSNSLFAGHAAGGADSLLRSPGSALGAQHDGSGTPTSGAGRALSDLRRFGSMFGAALGRREETRR